MKVKVKVAQSCLTLCDPMGYMVHGILQNTGVGSLSLLQGILPTQGLNQGLLHYRQILYQLSYEGSPMTELVHHNHKRGGGGLVAKSCLALETPWAVACQAPPSMGFSRILEWVAISFSRGSSQPRNWTQVSCIAGRFFTNWTIRQAQNSIVILNEMTLTFPANAKNLVFHSSVSHILCNLHIPTK